MRSTHEGQGRGGRGRALRVLLGLTLGAAAVLAGLGGALAGPVTQGSIGAGGAFACGVAADGTLDCWGNDAYSQVSTKPTGTFTAVSAGINFGCAIASDGSLHCWGVDSSGESSPPTGTFTDVSAGDAVACGIQTGGALACWGLYVSPVKTGFPAGTFTDVGVGNFTACAVATNGALHCWGDPNNGLLTPPAGTFTAVSVGAQYACGLATDATLHCWGTIGGNATAPSGTFTAVSVGANFACAIATGGTLDCWGTVYGTPPPGTADAVSVGLDFGCAILSDGSVQCWGDNSDNQVQPSLTNTPPNPTVGTAYSFTFGTTSINPAPAFALAAGSQLPAGLSLSPTGVISGTTTTAGAFSFTVSAVDGHAPTISGTFSITVNPGPPATVSLSPGDTSGTVGTSVTETATVKDQYGNLVADGTPVQWTIGGATSGTAGITQQDATTTNGQAVLAYTNTAAGQDSVQVVAGTSPNTASMSATVTWTPGPPAAVTLAPGTTTDAVGTPLTETATVRDQYGNAVADGTTVNFSVSGTTTTGGSATTTNGQASFAYDAIFPGTDMLAATAEGGSTPSATATITWTLPASTPGAHLGLANRSNPYVYGAISSGAGGVLTWRSTPVNFLTLHLTALVASGPNATLFGTATLSSGQAVTFRLDAVAGSRTVRLRLSTGYDSGTLHLLSVTVSP
ncbi:MAG TPA: putative Ig domain-containing protein [Thermomicrobiaceae bacterium]|nr:putative Ig domain-containing protein [Thermomicrobiaceae bacterium]